MASYDHIRSERLTKLELKRNAYFCGLKSVCLQFKESNKMKKNSIIRWNMCLDRGHLTLPQRSTPLIDFKEEAIEEVGEGTVALGVKGVRFVGAGASGGVTVVE
uniref:Uncharacterized protein n=1 Tax=Glossina brevipalpis TaxID=37001 RepID=A0A1A9WII3_9MUSC